MQYDRLVKDYMTLSLLDSDFQWWLVSAISCLRADEDFYPLTKEDLVSSPIKISLFRLKYIVVFVPVPGEDTISEHIL